MDEKAGHVGAPPVAKQRVLRGPSWIARTGLALAVAACGAPVALGLRRGRALHRNGRRLRKVTAGRSKEVRTRITGPVGRDGTRL